MRGTFANVRIKNLMLPPKADGSRVEGGVTLLQPEGEQMLDLRRGDDLHRATARRRSCSRGEEYGTGSSRDWAAKGTQLLGRQGGDRAQLRAHPPLQPGRHGRAAVPVQGQRQRRVARHRSATRRSISPGVEAGIRPQMDVTLTIQRRDGSSQTVDAAAAHRHADRGRLLPARRHPAVCAARTAGGVSRGASKTLACRRRRSGPGGRQRRLRADACPTATRFAARCRCFCSPGCACRRSTPRPNIWCAITPVPRRLGALCRPDAGGHAVCLAARRDRILAYAPVRRCNSCARRSCSRATLVLLRRIALPAPGRGFGDHLSRANLCHRPLRAAARRATHRASLGGLGGRASPAS